MREFILCTVAADDVDERNMTHNRYDMIARCVTAGLWVSHGLRKARVHIYLGKSGKVVTFTDKIKRVSPDERSIILWIKKALEGKRNEGITVKEQEFPEFIKSFGKIYVLHEEGKDIMTEKIEEDAAFVVGDHHGFTEEQEACLKGYDRISIGRKSYLSSQCITFINIGLDRENGKP